nr:HAMP domain-containing sensor histidine kinase [Lysinibacillus timonensis]
MKNNGKLLLTLFLIMWVAFAFTQLTNQGQRIIGKSYFESEDFQYTINSYKEQLGRFVLMPFDAEKAKETITVTSAEIDQYRNYYGSLTEQIESIHSQYSDRINMAEEDKNAALEEQLVLERDQILADITKNFESDEYVEEKIRKDREKQIDRYAQEQRQLQLNFLNEFNYFTYSFTNIETGEKIESQNVAGASAVYKESFGEQQSFLNVDSSVELYVEDAVYSIPEPLASFYVPGEVAKFEGTIYIPKNLLATSHLHSEYLSFNIVKYVFYFIWFTGILAAVALFTFAKPTLRQFSVLGEVENIFLKWPIDIRLIIVIVLSSISFTAMETVGNNLRYQLFYMNLHIDDIFFSLVMFFTTSATVFGLIWIWKSIKNEDSLKNELKNAYLYHIADGMRDLFLNRSLAIHTIFVLGTAFFAGIGFVGATMSGELAVIYLMLFVFIAIPVVFSFLRKMGYLSRIIKQTEDMAEGRLTSEIQIKGKSPLANHAKNLNRLREGVKKSMTEQAKSERLKTELITNVSHDLRTPLTSIITYTDLLKNPETTEEERNQYIDVLDKKSARLKTLIEDLFEVSKMASGNIEITKRRVDLTQLFQQAIGEHEEAFQSAGLDLKVTKPEQPLYAYVDGQKIWRVIDNLVVNSLKYSLKGTRVYISLKQNTYEAEFTVKNISNYELDDNVDELTERFKRADASRHTDGSGLGLAIAQSIVDLHNGRMKIDVDGDLFKVIVFIPTDS